MVRIVIGGAVLSTLFISLFLLRAGLENRIVGANGIITDNMALLIGVILLIFTFIRYKEKFGK